MIGTVQYGALVVEAPPLRDELLICSSSMNTQTALTLQMLNGLLARPARCQASYVNARRPEQATTTSNASERIFCINAILENNTTLLIIVITSLHSFSPELPPARSRSIVFVFARSGRRSYPLPRLLDFRL